MAVPKWWKSSQEARPESAAGPAVPAGATSVKQPADDRESEGTPSSDSSTALGGSSPPIEIIDEPRPILRVRSGKVELSLNPVSSFVAACVLVLLLVASYQFGTISGSGGSDVTQASLDRPGADTIEEALRQPINPSVLEPAPRRLMGDRSDSRQGKQSTAGVTIPKSSSAGITAGKRVPGLMYVILESFKSQDYQQAEFARTWLSEQKNVITTLEKKGDRWALISVDGFDNKQSAKQYRDAVISMGKEYNSEFRGKVKYNFRDPFVYTEQTPR